MPLGVAGLFQDSQVGFQQGGAPMSLWMADSLRAVAPARPQDWRTRLRDWAEDVELVPDLGQRIGSRTWFRGLATCFGLCASALYLSPGFQPVPGAPGPTLSDAHYDEVRSQMLTPLALGGDSGHRMGATDAVQPLRETPERPQIELSAQVGSSDTLARALSRAGVSSADVAAVVGMAGADISGGIKPGTRLNIVLGRRASRDRGRSCAVAGGSHGRHCVGAEQAAAAGAAGQPQRRQLRGPHGRVRLQRLLGAASVQPPVCVLLCAR